MISIISMLLLFIFIIIAVVLALIWEPIAFLLGKINVKARDAIVQTMIRVYFRIINFLTFSKIIYKGLDKIPKDQAVMYVGNHTSYFDVLVTYAVLPGKAGYIAKKDIENLPIVSYAMRMAYCLFLDRNSLKDGMRVIVESINNIKAGASQFVFPEGTRMKDGVMGEFKEGTMKIAVKAGCPIVPVAICNTSAILEDHMPIIKPAKVVVEFCDPIDPSSLDKEEQKHLGKKVHDVILEKRTENLKLI